PRRSLRLASEREPESLEQGLVERSEHVALVLAGVERTGERRRSVVVDDARVVAGGEPCSSDPVGEGDELVEAEAAVAAYARVRRQPRRVPVDERPDDDSPELLAQVERDMRDPARVTGRARLDHGRRRAAGALGIGAARVDPEAQRDTDRP